MASALLSSCSLLVSSPLPYHRPHHFSAGYESSSSGGYSHGYIKAYNRLFKVSENGGVYKFNCGNDEFFISMIYDSFMPMDFEYSDSRNFISVDDLTYSGSFYTITCNKDEHNWIIDVDPLMAAPDEPDMREIWVVMWDASDNSRFVFKFEQSWSEPLEYIQ